MLLVHDARIAVSMVTAYTHMPTVLNMHYIPKMFCSLGNMECFDTMLA